MTLIKACIISFSMYSKIPMPHFEWKEEDMKYALCFFPWVGLVIGALTVGWGALCDRAKLGTLCFTLGGAAIPLLVTGGFHVDGYMDTMDAFCSFRDREKKLEILKDSHIGAFSVIRLVLYYLIYLAAYSELKSQEMLVMTGIGFFLSRTLSGIGIVTFKSAKNDGLLCWFANTAHKRAVRVSLYLQLVICALVLCRISLLSGIAVLTATLLCFGYYRYRCYREIGGITGDTAGCFVTICEAVIVVTVAIAGRL